MILCISFKLSLLDSCSGGVGYLVCDFVCLIEVGLIFLLSIVSVLLMNVLMICEVKKLWLLLIMIGVLLMVKV